MARGFLGLGSNVGDRRSHLQAAVDGLGIHGVVVTRSSATYETEPVGDVLDQRAFYNAVIEIETDLGPEALLDACKAVERERGRVLAGEPGYVRHGPRPLDVDLLVLGDRPYRSDRLELPHREVASRRFVLVPLVELAPDLEIPGRGAAADALAALAGGEAVERAGAPLAVGRN